MHRTAKGQPCFCTLLLIFACLSGLEVTAAEFVGDLRMGSMTRMITGRIAVKDSIYRMDLVTGEGQYFVTVDQSTDESRVFDPATQTYRIVPTRSPQSLQNDPFQAVRYGDSIGVREFRGIDTVGKWICDRYAIRINGNPVMVEWVARELEWPVRIKNLMAADSAFVEIVNIEVGPVDESTFHTPEDYSLDEGKPNRSDQGGLGSGEELTRTVDPSRSVEVGLVNLSEGESTCVIDLLRGGVPVPETEVGPESKRTFTFKGVGDQTRRIFDNGADGVVVRVISGEVAVEVTQPE